MKLGSADIANLRLGSEQVTAVYLGAVQVWPAGLRLSGELNSATALSGEMIVSRPLAGASNTSSLMSAALAVLRPLAGALASGSSASGQMEVTTDVLLSGTLSVAAQSSGAMSVARALAGASDALSEMTGALSVTRVLAGAAEALSLNNGSVAVQRAMSGSMASASSADGDLDVEASAPTSLTFIASATSTGANITIPAGAAAGDLAILVDCGLQGNPGPSLVIPSGFTQVANTAPSNTRRMTTSRKVLVGGDPSSSITGMNGLGSNDKVLLVFRPDAAINSVTQSTWHTPSQTNANPPSQSVVASAGDPPLIVIGAASNSTSASAFSTASPAFDGTVTSSNRLIVGYKIYNSSPANHTIDMNDLGAANVLQSGYIAVS